MAKINIKSSPSAPARFQDLVVGTMFLAACFEDKPAIKIMESWVHPSDSSIFNAVTLDGNRLEIHPGMKITRIFESVEVS